MTEKLLAALFLAALLLVLVVLPIYVSVAAPCGALDWMPVTQVPARCLP